MQQLGTNARQSVIHADMLIAETAKVHGLALVHYDQDYDTIQRGTTDVLARVSWVSVAPLLVRGFNLRAAVAHRDVQGVICTP